MSIPFPVCSDQVESWLTGRGVQFQPPRLIPLDQIKRRESRSNQARFEAIVPEVVERYIAGVRAGEKFPPIVVYHSGQGYIIIDGNNRDEAHVKAGLSEIAAYEVDAATPQDMIDLLTVEANTRHGQPTDNGWRVNQAVHLLALGYSTDEVLRATGIGKTTLERGQRVKRSDERAARLRIYGWDGVTSTVRDSMASLSFDAVFVAFADMAVDTVLGVEDSKILLRSVRAATSEAEALRIISEMHLQRKAHKEGVKKGRRSAMRNPRMKMLSALGSVTSMEVEEAPRLFRTDEERKNLIGRAEDASLVITHLVEVMSNALAE